MKEQRFACTACGLCCYGLLPLTINEAISRADRFPLAISVTPVRSGTRGHTSISRIGVTASIGKGKPINLLVTPISFIPPSSPCPALGADNLCSIHNEKPERCKTMPFYAYKDEDSQRDMLVPRPGWECNTGDDAPVVYRDGSIIDKAEFSAERAALVEQAPTLQRYIDLLLKYDPTFVMRLQKGIHLLPGGKIVLNFASLLRHIKSADVTEYARRQHPVLAEWALKTADDPKSSQFHAYYKGALSEIARYLV
ncbi:YkgJ family cysteine cluster protein [Rhizobium sp. BG4]|jgi:Fe-S-cluster containining protein|nr:YkgJ family cysteine cluster protein [Rhizobium sp. BG4]QRM45141.1 YkgJ family cysteine cluster protein [Rhizobium sp. BG4]